MTEQDKKTETLLAEIQKAYHGVPATIETLRSCVIETLKAFDGIAEIGTSNKGHWIDIFFRSIGMHSGLPWCAAYIQYVYKFASTCLGLPDVLPYNSAGTLAIAKWAREHNLDLYSFSMVRPGDLIVWQNGKGSDKGHIAAITSIEFKQSSGMYIVETMEGNTSDASYRDGGTVSPKQYVYADASINPAKQSTKRFIRTIISFDKLCHGVVK